MDASGNGTGLWGADLANTIDQLSNGLNREFGIVESTMLFRCDDSGSEYLDGGIIRHVSGTDSSRLDSGRV